MNRGKQFEAQLRAGFLKFPSTISFNRIADPVGGFAGVRNCCDFIVYKNPTIFYLEAKSRKGNTFSLTDIPPNQYLGMLDKVTCKGVIAGFIIWYLDHQITAFVPIQEVQRLKDLGKKSINIKDILNNEVIHKKVPCIPKRILCEYHDMKGFLEEVGIWLNLE